jgi:hypothetical protein
MIADRVSGAVQRKARSKERSDESALWLESPLLSSEGASRGVKEGDPSKREGPRLGLAACRARHMNSPRETILI